METNLVLTVSIEPNGLVNVIGSDMELANANALQLAFLDKLKNLSAIPSAPTESKCNGDCANCCHCDDDYEEEEEEDDYDYDEEDDYEEDDYEDEECGLTMDDERIVGMVNQNTGDILDYLHSRGVSDETLADVIRRICER